VRGPHKVLYMNDVYLWPYDAASKLGAKAMVTDINGKPHMETCDPGVYPSYFWDFGKPAGAAAWLDIVRTHITEGEGDGVYVDCDIQIPFHCEDGNDTCTAKRNGKIKSENELVHRSVVEAYKLGRNTTMIEAFKLVGPNGSFYNKNAPQQKTFEQCITYDPATGQGRTAGDCSGNLIFTGPGGDYKWGPPRLHEQISGNIATNFPYVVVGGANSFSNPKLETPAAGQNISDGRSLKICDEDTLAQFLLGVEPGAFLLCNGWDARFERPLGKPLTPPAQSGEMWTRKFAKGVVATWNSTAKTGTVTWPDWIPPQA